MCFIFEMAAIFASSNGKVFFEAEEFFALSIINSSFTTTAT